MATGIIVRLVGSRNFGFIHDDAGGEVAFEGANVAGDGFGALKTGVRVQFTRATDPRGHRDTAAEVRVLGEGR